MESVKKGELNLIGLEAPMFPYYKAQYENYYKNDNCGDLPDTDVIFNIMCCYILHEVPSNHHTFLVTVGLDRYWNHYWCSIGSHRSSVRVYLLQAEKLGGKRWERGCRGPPRGQATQEATASPRS